MTCDKIKEYYDGTKWQDWPKGNDTVTCTYNENTTIGSKTIKIKDNMR